MCIRDRYVHFSSFPGRLIFPPFSGPFLYHTLSPWSFPSFRTEKKDPLGSFEHVEQAASGHLFEFLQGAACTPLAHTCPLRSAKSHAQVAAFCGLMKGRENPLFCDTGFRQPKKRTLSGPFFLYFFRQVSSPSSTSSTRVLPAGKSPRRMDFAISVSALLCRYRFKGRAP